MATKKKTSKKPARRGRPPGSKNKPKRDPRGRKKGYNGRPCKLTPEIQEQICESLRAGNYVEPSAIRAGVCKVTLYGWMKKGRQEMERVASGGDKCKVTARMEPYVNFLNAVKKAEADAEARDIAVIREASTKQWQASAWRLERKNYRRWGRKQALEHSSPEDKPVRVQRIVIGDQEIEF